MLDFFFWLLSRIPLRANHALGSALGSLAFLLSRRYREMIRSNIAQAGLPPETASRAKREIGMQSTEVIWIFYRSSEEILPYIQFSPEAEAVLESAMADGRHVVFFTPHIGTYEVSPLWAYLRILRKHGRKIVILYREPRKSLIRDVVARRRFREGVEPARADLGGVRRIIRAIRAGDTFGCLPDQVPGRGEGVWASFFGRPAFTMTFPLKVSRQFDAIRLFVRVERVRGRGWKIFAERWDEPLSGDDIRDAEAMNRQIEKAILACPEQYNWPYNRYKKPHGVHVSGDRSNG